MVRQSCCSDEGSSSIEVTRPGADPVVIHDQSADGAVISPDGRWLSVITGSIAVFDTKTGEEIDVDPRGLSDAFGYEWLDDSTLVVAALSGEAGGMSLLTCEIPAGACAEAGRLPELEGDAIAAIGLGEAIWGTGGSDQVEDA